MLADDPAEEEAREVGEGIEGGGAGDLGEGAPAIAAAEERKGTFARAAVSASTSLSPT